MGFIHVFKSNLFKGSIIYTGINFLNKAFPFILLPLFVRALSLSEFGEFSLFRAITNIFIPIIGFNLSDLIVRYFFDVDVKKSFNKYVYTSILINLMLLIVSLLFISFFNNQFLIEYLGLHKKYFYASFLISFFTSVLNIVKGLFRCNNDFKSFCFIVLGQSFVYFLAVILLFKTEKFSLGNLIFVEVLAFSLFFTVSLYFILKSYSYSIFLEKSSIKAILDFSTPLVLNSVIAYLFALSDRFIINLMLGAKEVALYSASYQLVSVLQILAVSFNAAWLPWVFKSLSEKMDMKQFNKIRLLVGGGFLFIGIFFYFIVIYFLPIILGDKYSNSASFISWFIGGTIFQLFYWLVVPIIQFYKKNWMLMYASIPCLIISIVLNYCFLDSLGVVFAAQVNFLTWGCLFLITMYNSQKILKYD
ncbi:membrane protein [Myroides odoratimimus]|uniref:lipopolysaccharide biosynthesis protein n=1 Tax=Myroides odoratimimus TaxID=76832 RepID=UPI00072B6C84|nr:oligosaccharide flippase family protein [Myroides odoratimimus]GAQ14818.1 membrane protein [Myroides odoratimimus]STZ48875.1 Polysaccharide biosynthesis protein [Myroides odoratimimus]